MKTRNLYTILFALIPILCFENVVLGCNCPWWTQPDLCHVCVDLVWVDTCVGCESCNEHLGLYGTCEDDDNNCSGWTPYCVDGSCQQCRTSNDCPACSECDNYICVNQCPLGQCCLNGNCVDTCTEYGKCDHGVLPGGPYANCPSQQDIETGRCNGGEGLLCGHRTLVGTNEAHCATCKPNCGKVIVGPCVTITPATCKTSCYIMVCACICDVKWESTSYSGDLYGCPE